MRFQNEGWTEIWTLEFQTGNLTGRTNPLSLPLRHMLRARFYQKCKLNWNEELFPLLPASSSSFMYIYIRSSANSSASNAFGLFSSLRVVPKMRSQNLALCILRICLWREDGKVQAFWTPLQKVFSIICLDTWRFSTNSEVFNLLDSWCRTPWTGDQHVTRPQQKHRSKFHIHASTANTSLSGRRKAFPAFTVTGHLFRNFM